MDFQAYLKAAYRIIREKPVVLIGGGLLIQLLTFISLGLLAGPLLGGYTLMVIVYLREDKKPDFKDVLSGFQQFTVLFPYFLVLLLIFLGFMLLLLPGLLLATWWIYVLPLMADRKIPFVDAMRLSMNRVNEKGLFMHLVFLLIVYVIPYLIIDFVSALIPPVQLLNVLLPPLQIGCLAGLYLDMFNPGEAVV